MNPFQNYLNKISLRRVIVMLFGVVLTGWGIATFRLAAPCLAPARLPMHSAWDP